MKISQQAEKNKRSTELETNGLHDPSHPTVVDRHLHFKQMRRIQARVAVPTGGPIS
jgi:hypothetical protein